MALEEYEYQIGPYTIEPVWVDSQSDPAKASQAYEQAVVEDGIQAGAVNWHSSVAVSVMEVTAKYQIPHIFGFGATEIVNETYASDPDKYGYWSTKGWPTPYKLGAVYVEMLEYYIDQGVYAPESKKLAIFGEDTDWGRSFGGAVAGLFEDAGWEVVYEEYFPLTQTEFSALWTKFIDADVEVVAGTSTGVNSYAAFISQAEEVGYEGLIVADGLGWVDFCDLTGSSAAGVIDMIPDFAGEEGEAFAAEFEERYDLSPSPSSAGLSFDGTKMFMEIAQAVYDLHGELSSELIYEFLRDEVLTGNWSMTDGLIMKEYKYTPETAPDPVIGADYYTFPVRQYEYVDGECVGKIIFPSNLAVQDLTP
jgi:branched-chain amino acid transport system substrate-binding protein